MKELASRPEIVSKLNVYGTDAETVTFQFSVSKKRLKNMVTYFDPSLLDGLLITWEEMFKESKFLL